MSFDKRRRSRRGGMLSAIGLTGTTKTNGGRAHTHVLGDLDEGVGHLRGVGTLGLEGDWRGLGTGRVQEGGGALHGVEGGGLAGGGCSEAESMG